MSLPEPVIQVCSGCCLQRRAKRSKLRAGGVRLPLFHCTWATFGTDGFGRARFAVSTKNRPSNSLPNVIGEKEFCSKAAAYIEPTERIGCGAASHSPISALLGDERKSTNKIFAPVWARNQSTLSTAAGPTVNDINILFFGSLGCASRD